MLDIEELYQLFLKHPSVVTDTRLVKKDDIFFALKGPNFNGNSFAEQALKAGAAYAIVDEKEYATLPGILLTDDVLYTLQQLAKHHRQQFNIPVIAVTGSNGKTTTKELIHAVLSTSYKTYTTQGNLNNHIGIPLTLLNIKPDAEVAIVEMGANHQKEIESYCTYTLPTHGIITNCGKAHLEGFGGIEGVKKGKGELFDYLRVHSGGAFVCADFGYFREMAKDLKNIFWYGTKEGKVTGSVIKSEPFTEIQIDIGLDASSIIRTQLVGDYNLYNVLAASAIGKYFDVPSEKIVSAIENYVPSNSRSQLLEKDGNKIILDAYNANPTSMQAAIENFAHLNTRNKILFLGAMMELGVESLEEHKAIITLLKKYSWKEVILVGGDFAAINNGFRFFPDSDGAYKWWSDHHSRGNYLLVKGSRSMKMEKVIG